MYFYEILPKIYVYLPDNVGNPNVRNATLKLRLLKMYSSCSILCWVSEMEVQYFVLGE